MNKKRTLYLTFNSYKQEKFALEFLEIYDFTDTMDCMIHFQSRVQMEKILAVCEDIRNKEGFAIGKIETGTGIGFLADVFVYHTTGNRGKLHLQILDN